MSITIITYKKQKTSEKNDGHISLSYFSTPEKNLVKYKKPAFTPTCICYYLQVWM